MATDLSFLSFILMDKTAKPTISQTTTLELFNTIRVLYFCPSLSLPVTPCHNQKKPDKTNNKQKKQPAKIKDDNTKNKNKLKKTTPNIKPNKTTKLNIKSAN